MAYNVNLSLRNNVIYSIYVRNHTQEGTFLSIIPDLDRIKALGTDIIWFMPIHPIGEKGKKGSLGCPYANRDYRTVNPEYGTMEDFKALVNAIHDRDMKCIIDVVYNHTSPDATLTTEHPEFYYRRPDGSMGNHVGDWTDIVDLDYACQPLWDYQIESLAMWAEIVDGFRCDVASFIPVEFWCRAREAVEKVRPGCIWLAETVHSSFAQNSRKHGMYCATDYQMYDAFDIEYEYDVREVFDRYLNGESKLSNYIDVLNFQECQYPAHYNKLRFLENHDQPRICSFVKDKTSLVNLTAFLYFQKGSTLIYAGQEYMEDHLPSLFDKDVFIRSTDKDISALLKHLYKIKNEQLSCDDRIWLCADDTADIAVLLRDNNVTKKLGIFSFKGKSADVAIPFQDGNYRNYFDNQMVVVSEGKIHCAGSPIILIMNN